ncbi:hypothetical protein [[Pseudomonas] boreopolis]|uniref:Uncharacterized protein n=1 Tax=Xanthomonas boreopolis TaxID=86183 RepID=A0A919KIH8_9XANT|nr:hypothetical protein GCM10009090_17760 [[Pseudomonas] boreopolis]
MSAPVDVLAVLRAARDSVPAEQLLDYCAAVAAVAELIKRGNRIEQWSRGAIWGDGDAVAQGWAEFRAAMARAKGGAQ